MKDHNNMQPDDGYRETLNKQFVVLKHLQSMSTMIMDSTVEAEQYNRAIEHLSGLLEGVKDETFRQEERKLHVRLQYAYRTRRNNVIAAERQNYYKSLFVMLNNLADRVGLGWRKEAKADFHGYREYLKDNKGKPAQKEFNYGVRLIEGIRDNIYKDKRNWLGLFVGKVGSGKSYSALSLAYMLDPNFSIKRVVFTDDDFMKLVRSDLPVGSFIMADEIGSWLPARDYMMKSNKTLSYVLQTFRKKRLGVIWTVPQRRQVDVTLRSMSDAIFETTDIWPESNRCIAKMKYCNINPMTGNEITPFPTLPIEGEGDITITRVLFPKPEANAIRSYEEKKGKWLDEFYAKKHKELKELNPETGKKYKRVTKKEMILKDIAKGKLSNLELARKHKTAERYIRDIKSTM